MKEFNNTVPSWRSDICWGHGEKPERLRREDLGMVCKSRRFCHCWRLCEAGQACFVTWGPGLSRMSMFTQADTLVRMGRRDVENDSLSHYRWTVHLVQGRRRWTGWCLERRCLHWFCAWSFCQLDTNERHMGRGRLEELIAFIRLAFRCLYRGFCWCCFIDNWYGRTEPTVGGTTSGHVALGCRRNQDEQAFIRGLS